MEKRQARGRGGVPTLGQSKVQIDRTAKYACFVGYVRICFSAEVRFSCRRLLPQKGTLSQSRYGSLFLSGRFRNFDILIKKKNTNSGDGVVSFSIFINVTETRSAE